MTKKQPPKESDLPATRGMLEAVRQDLKTEMREGFFKVDVRFNQMESRFSLVESKIEKVLNSIAQMHLDNEKQRADNRIVFEGLGLLRDKQNRIEERFEKIEKY